MITFGHCCPHCGIERSGFEVKTHYENQKYSNMSLFSILATCNSCDGSVIADIKISDYSNYATPKIDAFRNKLMSKNYYNLSKAYSGLVEFYPNHQRQADIPDKLPDSVVEELKTAEDLYLQIKAKPHFVKATGNAYRTTLERALCELAENDNRAKLNKRIEKLFNDGKLTKDLKNFALHIRLLSAEASHTYNDFTLEELEELRLFTQLFLKYTFTLPKMIPDESKEEVDNQNNQ
ncbi:DUF4145 domain-containing protein [Pasteurella canis]|uniref:DUF4145 domain-containing protein n=1 Tax=Pasteurella canis TaxID=753 RepID=A0ABQ4VH70_9PAST|nr:DUF4145 domain-containing protein [Pasteurella canis]GJH43115.1 hypothetical protein PA42_12890 [Pasteurella canis]